MNETISTDKLSKYETCALKFLNLSDDDADIVNSIIERIKVSKLEIEKNN